MCGGLTTHEARQRRSSVSTDSGVVIHMQDPRVLRDFAAAAPYLQGVLVYAGLEPASVRSAVFVWHGEQSRIRIPAPDLAKVGYASQRSSATTSIRSSGKCPGRWAESDSTTRSKAGIVSRLPIVGTTTISMSATTGEWVSVALRALDAAVTTPYTPRMASETGDVHTTVAYQPIAPVVASAACHRQPRISSEDVQDQQGADVGTMWIDRTGVRHAAWRGRTQVDRCRLKARVPLSISTTWGCSEPPVGASLVALTCPASGRGGRTAEVPLAVTG